ncbi:MAG TPA: recombinase RecF, partial [Bacteroidia bacterium]|nr:recombinase RecF [Bacteroidia bacterium]
SPVIDVDGLKQKRNELRNNISELNQQLALEGELQRIEERIAQLLSEEKTMAQELADLERKEYLISEFTKAKIDAIEKQINAKFTLAKFKMFEQQINGGETEICECLMNGVPFSDLNTASKINVGVDIINVLSAHYKVIAPIFIDNRESINNLIETKSQIINLIVSKEKNLIFEKIN